MSVTKKFLVLAPLLAAPALYAAEFEILDRFSVDGYTVLRGAADIPGGGFTVGGSTFVVKGGNVGIGTTAPSRKLTIASSASNTNTQLLYLKQPNDYGYSFNLDDQNTGRMYLYGVNAGVETTSPIMTLDRSNGYIGIGTTGPSTKLEVAGTVTIASQHTLGASSVVLNPTGSVTIRTSDMGIGGVVGDITIQNGYSNGGTAGNILISSHHNNTGSSGAVTVQSGDGAFGAGNVYIKGGNEGNYWGAGNVYISGGGTTSDHPASVIGNVYIRGGAYTGGTYTYGHRDGDVFLQTAADGVYSTRFIVKGYSGNVGIGTTGPAVKFDIRTGAQGEIAYFLGSGSNGLILGSNTTPQYGYVSSGSSSTGLVLGINGNAPKLFIDTTGNVGIGTTAPGTRLEVANGSFMNSNSSTAGLLISGNAISNPGYMGIRLTLSNTTADYAGFIRAARTSGTTYIGMEIGSETNHGIRFLTNGTADSAERMRIDPAGNVGIGTTNPVATLDIGGTGSIKIPVGTTLQRPTPANGMMRFNSDTSSVEIYFNNRWFRLAPTCSATGGNISIINGYCIHTFTATGTFQVTTDINTDILVVAGGGGGGAYAGGGGGGGGFTTATNQAVTAGAYTATVGVGGTGGASGGSNSGTNGGNSTFLSITSLGGGGGAHGYNGASATGLTGGSGGGSTNGTGGAGTSGQGNNGGTGTTAASQGGGGGGGANSTGYTGAVGLGGVGGAGKESLISGSSAYYSGGGGGGDGSGGSEGTGGTGGGGIGGSTTGTGTAGGANTGGGGGGGGYPTQGGFNGGSGIVIIRYPF